MNARVRWLQEYYEATREEIVAYRDEHECGFVEAKLALQPHIDPVLQYWDEVADVWIEVPTVRFSLGKRFE